MWRVSLAASLQFSDFFLALPWMLFLFGSAVAGSSLRQGSPAICIQLEGKTAGRSRGKL